MEIITKIKGVLTEPRTFFSQIGKEKGIGPAFVYYLLLTILSSVLAYIVMTFTGNISAKIIYGMMGAGELAAMADPRMMYGGGMLIVMFILGIGAALVGSFILAGILHVWILIFGGKNTYTETYKLYVYQATPRLLFGWIPIVNFFIWIWQLVLLIMGTMQVHNISRKKAILMYVIPLIVILGLMVFALIWVGMMFTSGMAAGMM